VRGRLNKRDRKMPVTQFVDGVWVSKTRKLLGARGRLNERDRKIPVTRLVDGVWVSKTRKLMG